MKILKGILLLVATSSLALGSDSKSKKIDGKHKKTGKRQIGYGLEAIPGVAFHAPLADDGFVAIARPTAHGGIGGYGLVQPIGLIHAPQADNIGFTGQGFDAYSGGYGVYPPQAFVAAPVIDFQHVPRTHQLDNGWKGIEHGYGSIKHGHEVAQSLASKLQTPYQDGVFAPILPVLPQYDISNARNIGYSSNAILPTYSGFGATGKGFAPSQNSKHHVSAQGNLPKGYGIATLNGNQNPQIGPSYHHVPGHTLGQNHKGHGSISHGHQLASQGHQLAKTIHIPKEHSGFIGSHGPKIHHEKAHLYSHQKAASPSQSYGFSSPGKQTYQSAAPVRQNIGPSAPSRQISYDRPSNGPLSNPERPSHDSTSHSTSYSTDVNTPHSSFSPDFSPSAGLSSSEQSDSNPTNGHGGHYSGEKKATSFQSFIIHSYKPHQVSHKTKYDSHESDENLSEGYNSAQAFSGENHF